MIGICFAFTWALSSPSMIVTSFAHASHRAIVFGQAKAVFESVQKDAGDVWRGEIVHATFSVKNEGAGTLEIDAKPTCGCTIATFDKAIGPGETGQIRADLKTEAYHAAVQKTIVVTTNDPTQPRVNLTINANIHSEVDVLPSETPIVSLNETGSTTQEVDLHVADGSAIQRVACGWVYAVPTLRRDPSKPHSYILSIKIGPEAPSGRNAFATTLFTSSKLMPQLNFTTITEKGIVVSPPVVFFGTITPERKLPATQILTLSRRTQPFHVTKVNCDDPAISVHQDVIKPGLEYRLTLSYRGGWPAGTVQHKIQIETDDPKQPKLESMVLATVLGKP